MTAELAGKDPRIEVRNYVLDQLHNFQANNPPNFISSPADSTEANPWLRQTQWDHHLRGHNPVQLAPLVDLPYPDEPILTEFAASLDRIIEQARDSVLSQKINIFDQTAINMFNDHQTKAGHPLSTNLQEGTYARYKGVWKKLLCFVYRFTITKSYVGNGSDLPYRLTEPQQKALSRSIRFARQLCKQQHLSESESDSVLKQDDELRSQLDHLLVRFCMSLLDHQLRGDIYESIVVGFLAVLGIDETNVKKLFYTTE